MSRPDDAPVWLVNLYVAAAWAALVAPAAALLVALAVLA